MRKLALPQLNLINILAIVSIFKSYSWSVVLSIALTRSENPRQGHL